MGEATVPLMLVGITVLIVGGALYGAYLFRTTDFGPLQFYGLLGVFAFAAMVFGFFRLMSK